jgi:hypothetical protein
MFQRLLHLPLESRTSIFLFGPRGLFAFEIKRTAHISSKMLRSLKSFSEEYPHAKLYILHLGDHNEY